MIIPGGSALSASSPEVATMTWSRMVHFELSCFHFILRYLPEYMWRQKVERQDGDHFEEFLKIIAAKQNQDDPEFDLREV